jgi:hypothetical protein
MMNYCGQKILPKFAIALLILILSVATAAAQEYLQLPAAIHMSSDISDGKLSLEAIAAIASVNDIAVLIPTDRDSMSWEYGIGPLRNIFKKRVAGRSVFSYGIKKYLQRLDSLKKKYPGMIIIPGVESAPYYYWQGSIFNDDLVIRDWHKHMLVVGLAKPADLEYLPVLGNSKGFRQPFDVRSIFLAWPLALAAFGIWCVRRRKPKIGIVIFLISILFLINNFPFRYQKFDQYHGSMGVMPYQNLIDYANGRKGLTFWAHPEAANKDKSGPVSIETDEHSDYLLKTRGYTGFAIFYEGFKRVGSIGGVWDRILLEYCKGNRKSPIWAIGGLSYDKTGSLESYMNDVRTVLLSRGSTAPDAMDALKNGRMYCLRGKDAPSFVLDQFTVTDAEGNDKTMGEQSNVGNNPIIRIEAHLLRGQDKSFTIQLIKDGALLRVFETVSPFAVSHVDSLASESPRSYYRVQITSRDLVVISNPIFVQRQ